MRIGIAGFMHESNTFSDKPTDLDAFRQQSLVEGDDLIKEWQPAHHEIGGFLQAAGELGFEPVPLLMAWATPSGPVTKDAYETITARLVELLKEQKLDGLLLALHGAMVAEDLLDADGETQARIRAALGSDVPIVTTLDFHGNVSEKLIQNCNAVVAYQTNPHVDQRECGIKAVTLLVRQIRGEVQLTQALAKPATIINIMKQDTSQEPLASHLHQARLQENEPGILSISLMAGFSYADVPQMGPSVIVVTDNDQEQAQKYAQQMSDILYEQRESFNAELPSAAEAVEQALKTDQTPVVLVDTGDNVGGGSTARETEILRELLKQNASGFVICLCDPKLVELCDVCGIGQEVQFDLEKDLHVRGKVRVIHDGRYVEHEVRHGGKRVNEMGMTVLLELENDSLLVLTTERHPPFSLGQLTCLGIQPEWMKILVVKAAIAYKAAYGPIAKTIIEVGTRGWTAVNPKWFSYSNVRRPLYPLD